MNKKHLIQKIQINRQIYLLEKVIYLNKEIVTLTKIELINNETIVVGIFENDLTLTKKGII